MADVQWWLATLDQYGNPTLIDGAHSGRAGVEQAMKLYGKLASEDNFLGRRILSPQKHTATRYAVVRCEVWPLPAPPVDQKA